MIAGIKASARKNWFGYATITISLIALTAAVFAAGGASLARALTSVRKIWIAAAFLLVVLYWLLEAVSINVLTRIKYKRYRLRDSFKSGMTGLLYSALTPFATGGQPMQVYEMSKTGVSVGDAMSVIGVKSIIYQAVMIGFGAVAFAFSGGFFRERISRFGILVAWGFVTNVAFILVVALACLNPYVTQKCAGAVVGILAKTPLIKNAEGALAKVRAEIITFHDSVASLGGRPFTVALAVLVNILETGALYSIPYCIYRGFDLREAGYLYLAAANALVAAVAAFFPLPGGTGAAEGGFYLFFSAFFPEGLLLFSTLIWRVVTYYACILCGAAVGLIAVARKK